MLAALAIAISIRAGITSVSSRGCKTYLSQCGCQREAHGFISKVISGGISQYLSCPVIIVKIAGVPRIAKLTVYLLLFRTPNQVLPLDHSAEDDADDDEDDRHLDQGETSVVSGNSHSIPKPCS